MNLALIGCGAIGTGVLELLQSHPHIHTRWLLASERSIPAAQTLAAQYAPNAQILSALPATERPDLIVECAGHTAVEQHILPALERGIDAVIASIGALSAPGMAEHIQTCAETGNAQVHLVSGAIGGIDALAAARIGGLDNVTYTGRKPPLAWRGTPADQVCDLAALTAAHCIFEGSAREAALKKTVKTLEVELDRQAHDHYATLSEAEVKALVVEDKWLARLQADVRQELERISQTLAQRIRELAERYETPLPKLEDEVAAFSAKVEAHLKRMGATWK